MFKNPRLALIIGILFIDSVVAGGVGPLLNKYTETLSGKQVWVMAGSALLLGAQLVTSPVLAAISNKIGRRPVLIGTSLMSLLASFFLLPVNVFGYLTNRGIEGTTNGMLSILRSAVVDTADDGDVVQQTGILGSVTALGAIFGPAVGGILIISLAQARYDAKPLVIMGIILAVVNVVLTFIFKETSTKEKQPIDPKELREKAFNALKIKTLWGQLADVEEKLKGFKALFIIQLLTVLSLGYYNYFIAYLIVGDLGLTYREASYFFIYYGLITLTVNLVFFQLIVKHINQRKVMIFAAIGGIGVMALYALSGKSITMLYFTGALDAVTAGLLTGLITGQISALTAKGGGSGQIFGDSQALGGVASFLTAVMTTILTALDPRAPFAFFALAMAVMAYRVATLPEESAVETRSENQK
ncbi:MFS transporter [Fibrella aquatilis]|uniref:MFS transporter n=1 Tax=Fibrella aquatilis TaxID=2817059 RepID=A0A939JVN0_9BACT|nr:MFS transporter [Fibrella aquatilis]MBO0931027.1 MFS transporter [Fibrella aquatilis]